VATTDQVKPSLRAAVVGQPDRFRSLPRLRRAEPCSEKFPDRGKRQNP